MGADCFFGSGLRVGGIIISLLIIGIVSLKPIGLMRIMKLLRTKMAKILKM